MYITPAARRLIAEAKAARDARAVEAKREALRRTISGVLDANEGLALDDEDDKTTLLNALMEALT